MNETIKIISHEDTKTRSGLVLSLLRDFVSSCESITAPFGAGCAL